MEIDRASVWTGNQMRCTGVRAFAGRRWNGGEQMLLMAFESLCDCPFIIQWATIQIYISKHQISFVLYLIEKLRIKTDFSHNIQFLALTFNSGGRAETKKWNNQSGRPGDTHIAQVNGRISKIAQINWNTFYMNRFFCHHFFFVFRALIFLFFPFRVMNFCAFG